MDVSIPAESWSAPRPGSRWFSDTRYDARMGCKTRRKVGYIPQSAGSLKQPTRPELQQSFFREKFCAPGISQSVTVDLQWMLAADSASWKRKRHTVEFDDALEAELPPSAPNWKLR